MKIVFVFTTSGGSLVLSTSFAWITKKPANDNKSWVAIELIFFRFSQFSFIYVFVCSLSCLWKGTFTCMIDYKVFLNQNCMGKVPRLASELCSSERCTCKTRESQLCTCRLFFTFSVCVGNCDVVGRCCVRVCGSKHLYVAFYKGIFLLSWSNAMLPLGFRFLTNLFLNFLVQWNLLWSVSFLLKSRHWLPVPLIFIEFTTFLDSHLFTAKN